MTAIVLNLEPLTRLDRDRFYQLCQANRDLVLERSKNGELLIMSPVGGESGSKEADLITDLNLWNRNTGLGKVFSSSTIFSLPNNGDRSPDAAWVRLERWNALTKEQQEKFPPICPDFVIELRSKTDRMKSLQEKMQEYLDSGLPLGWLINPQSREVEIYRQGRQKEVLKTPVVLSGEDVLPGFVLEIR